MGVTYFKRFRMEVSLTDPLFAIGQLPSDYRLVAWDDTDVAAHSEVKFRSFCYEIDANVFPCLGDREGCQRLMGEIARRESFVPQATWLLQYHGGGLGRSENCGTIQGIVDSSGMGSLQNVGVTPLHRGRGLGTHLMYQSLLGFREIGLQRAALEVTAQNLGAVRLYERLGFRRVKTVYKVAEVAYA